MASKNGKAKSEALNPKQIPNTNLNTRILNGLVSNTLTFSRLKLFRISDFEFLACLSKNIWFRLSI